MKYKIGELEVEAIQWTGANDDEIYRSCREIIKGDYFVKSQHSVFILSEQDFNKIATKVKEPRFKVGDVVYKREDNSWKISFRKCLVSQIYEEEYLLFSENCQYQAHQSVLFTLEEVIELLKEL